MICAKSGQNWSCGSGAEVENVKVYRQTNDGQQVIRKAHCSGELKSMQICLHLASFLLAVKRKSLIS
jgi:hypothetical protein